jgi:hypothetical protein
MIMKKQFLLLSGSVALAALLSGCGGEHAVANTAPAAAKEIRGERIQANTAPAQLATSVVAGTQPAGSTGPATPAAQQAKLTTPTTPKTEQPQTVDDFPLVGFDKLAAYTYEMPEETTSTAAATNDIPKNWIKKDQIPDNIRAFNGKRVAIKGFMLPLKVEKGLITEMLIMRDQSACCYGSVPKINEWVSVKMKEGVKPAMDQAITLFGTLKVGEIRENGYLVGIYEMDGERMAAPLDL